MLVQVFFALQKDRDIIDNLILVALGTAEPAILDPERQAIRRTCRNTQQPAINNFGRHLNMWIGLIFARNLYRHIRKIAPDRPMRALDEGPDFARGSHQGLTAMDAAVLDKPAAQIPDERGNYFSHVKVTDTDFKLGGLRDFFEYRDLGIAAATGGKVIAHLVRAKNPPDEGTGWHQHIADFQIVLMTKGWARFMYEDKVVLVEAGDCVHQRPGITHFLFDYSPDMEYLEIVGPADFGTVDAAPPTSDVKVPPPTPWA